MKYPSMTASDTSNVVWIDDEAQSAAHTNQTVPVGDHDEFTIGELAREFGVTLRALRFYESKGFIAPRREKNVRLYSQSDRARIAAILAGKKLGFTLAEIRTMISGMDAQSEAAGLKVTEERCLEQIHALEKQQLTIKDALAELWRIHAGLSAAIIRIDRRDSMSQPALTAAGG
jgi:DNA-binding transcriptional MerR regulator